MHYTLSDIPVSLFLGVPEAERAEKQKILIDLEFDFVRKNKTKDDIFQGLLSYGDVCRALQDFPKEKEFITLEYLFESLQKHLETLFPEAKNWKLRITKFPFPEGSISLEF